MNENNEKKAYVKPEFEVIDLNNELPILCSSGSDFGSGGRWGF